MMERAHEIRNASPRSLARSAGFLYLIVIAAGAFALLTRSSLIVRGEAAATTSNILASELLYRFAFASELIAVVAYVGVTAILYKLLRPVNDALSLMGAFFSLTGCAIAGITLVNHMAPLFFLGGDGYLSAFHAEQLQALARVSLRSYGLGYDIGLVFFGFYCLSIGYLIFRSTFMPRIIGVLLMITGVNYLFSNFAFFLYPAFGAQLYPYNLVPVLLGEGALAVWLAGFGVNAEKWKAQAGPAVA